EGVRLSEQALREAADRAVVVNVVHEVHGIARCAREEHVLVDVLAALVLSEVDVRPVLRRLAGKSDARELRGDDASDRRANPERACGFASRSAVECSLYVEPV